MKNQIAPLGRQEDIVVQELNDEVLIYDLKENKAFCLNETSALVWQMCNGENSVADISQTIGKKLNSPANEDLVWLAIDQLKKENLIANSEEVVPNFNGLSRREVIRKVGLSTMLAIPTILALHAPTAAQGASTTSGACDATEAGCLANTACACPAAVTCPEGFVAVSANATVGACASATVAADLGIVEVDANADGVVCIVANACVVINTGNGIL